MCASLTKSKILLKVFSPYSFQASRQKEFDYVMNRFMEHIQVSLSDKVKKECFQQYGTTVKISIAL